MPGNKGVTPPVTGHRIIGVIAYVLVIQSLKAMNKSSVAQLWHRSFSNLTRGYMVFAENQSEGALANDNIWGPDPVAGGTTVSGLDRCSRPVSGGTTVSYDGVFET